MRITVDATPLLVHSAGVKAYLYYWILALRGIAGDDAIRTSPPIRTIATLDHVHSLAGRWETSFGHFLLHGSNKIPLPIMDLAVAGSDIFHACSMNRRPPSRPKLTATLYDMTAWLLPQFHTPANVRAERAYADNILKRAHGIISISESSRQDAIRLLNLNERLITAIPPGVDERYFQVTDHDATATTARLGLDKPYVLVVGTIEPRKNVDRILDSWELLPQGLREQFDLVFAGSAGWAQTDTLKRLESGMPGVRWLGYVAESDLPAITKGAALLSYPSIYEGWGLPLAQAMASGIPAVTANVSSMPEVTAGTAELVDPNSPAEIAAATARLLNNPSDRARRGQAARGIAEQRYRWPVIARRSLDFFQSLL
jgi:glycosyltransferase involved in cell wall biosynthesis